MKFEVRNISHRTALGLTHVCLLILVNNHRRNGLGILRRGFSAADRSYAVHSPRMIGHALAALLFLAILARTGSDFFHTEGPVTAGVTISAPCNACDLEATTALGAPPPPVLPPLTVSSIEIVVVLEARPFASAILHTNGRAPPEA